MYHLLDIIHKGNFHESPLLTQFARKHSQFHLFFTLPMHKNNVTLLSQLPLLKNGVVTTGEGVYVVIYAFNLCLNIVYQSNLC